MKKVAFILDNPLRDLPSLVLTAQSLVHEGVEVAIVPFYGVARFLFAYTPDMVVLNYARVNNASLIRKLKYAGIMVSVLDTEGGVFGQYKEKESNDYLQTVIEDEETRDLIDTYFVWGETLFDVLKKNKIYKEKQLLLTGTPRMDFYHSSLEHFFQNPVTEDKSKLVLISSSFPMVNPKYQSVQNEKDMMVKSFNYSIEYINDMFNKLDAAKDIYVERSVLLAQRFPEINFVYRPHPFENENFYSDKFQGVPNLKVIKEGVIGDWLARSLALIHFESSSSFEAMFMGLPALAYDEFKKIWNILEIQAVTHYQHSFEEMSSTLQDVISQRYQTPKEILDNKESLIKGVYFKLDGGAHVRIKDKILSVINISSGPQFIKAKMFFIFEFVKIIIKKLLGKSKVSGKEFTGIEVESILLKLRVKDIKVVTHSNFGEKGKVILLSKK